MENIPIDVFLLSESRQPFFKFNITTNLKPQMLNQISHAELISLIEQQPSSPMKLTGIVKIHRIDHNTKSVLTIHLIALNSI